MNDDAADSTSFVVALAEGLCAHLGTRTHEDCGRVGYLPHDYISDFENAFALLWRMGLALAASPRQDMWDIEYNRREVFGVFPPCFRLVPQDEIAPMIRARALVSKGLIEELVDSYICVLCDYGGLSHGRAWFVPASGHLTAMREFARHGYSEQDVERFRWTDKVIPAMRKGGQWTDAGRPRSEVEDEEILAFFAQLPAVAQAELAELACEPHASLTFTATLAQNHFGAGWVRHFPELGNSPMQIGTRLYALLAAGVRPQAPS